MSVEVVLKNVTTTTGEGPHWDDVSQSLLFVDINNGNIHRWNSLTGIQESMHLEGTVGFVVPARKGGYIAGLNKSMVHFGWESQTTTELHKVDGEKFTRFNDGKCDPAGRVWAGTMGLRNKNTGLRESYQGALYSLDVDGSIQTKVDKVTLSNGLAWTEDNRTMYYIDSGPRKVYAYDFDVTNGAISNRKIVVDFGSEDTPEGQLEIPDGMAIDTEGKLWVACYRGGKVVQFDPETGKDLRTINFPAKRTTSCCFGGKNLNELYVTCAKDGLTEEEFKNEQPLAGSVFKVTGLGAMGRPAYMYEG